MPFNGSPQWQRGFSNETLLSTFSPLGTLSNIALKQGNGPRIELYQHKHTPSNIVYGRAMSFQPKQYARLDRPRTEWNLKVEKPQHGAALGEFLMKKLKWFDDTSLQSLMEKKQIKILRAPSSIRAGGDTLWVEISPDSKMELLTNDMIHIGMPVPEGLTDPHSIPLTILHDDGVLLGINKQAGCAVQPKMENDMDNILTAL